MVKPMKAAQNVGTTRGGTRRRTIAKLPPPPLRVVWDTFEATTLGDEAVRRLVARGSEFIAGDRVDVRKALSFFDRALALDPNHANAHFFRGFSLSLAKKPVDALAAYDRAIECDPNLLKLAAVHLVRADAFRQSRQFREAIGACDQAISLDAAWPDPHCQLAHTLIDSRCWEEAVSASESAIALDPNDARARAFRAYALGGLNRSEEAIEEVERSVALKPDFDDAYTLIGAVYARAGEAGKAIKCFLKAIELDPLNTNAIQSLHNFVENIDFEKHRKGEYNEYVNKATDLNAVAAELKIPPNDAERYLRLAAAEISARETAKRATAEPHPLSGEQPVLDSQSPWRRAKKKGENLPEYIARIYQTEIATGTLATADLSRDDEKLYKDFYEWRRKWKNRKVPDDLRWLYELPNKHERAAQQPAKPVRITDYTPAEQEIIRRYEADKRHAQRHRPAQEP